MKNLKFNKAVLAGIAIVVLLVGIGTWVMAEPLPAENQSAAAKKPMTEQEKKKQELEELKKQLKEQKGAIENDAVFVKQVLDANKDQKCNTANPGDICGKIRGGVHDAAKKGKDLVTSLLKGKGKSLEDGGCPSDHKCTFTTTTMPNGNTTTTVTMEPVK